MHSQGDINRHQLQQALNATGCALDLDTALADPTLARCLQLTAKAMQRIDTPPTTPPQAAELARARRLLSWAGRTDFARLRAGDTDKD